VPTRAFILIETQVGKVQVVRDALRSMEGIRSADTVTGNFDIIALVEAADMASMAELVTGQIQGVRGVMRTITCVAAG
jgi:DNA-binding Lrp family transcriptional regulator